MLSKRREFISIVVVDPSEVLLTEKTRILTRDDEPASLLTWEVPVGSDKVKVVHEGLRSYGLGVEAFQPDPHFSSTDTLFHTTYFVDVNFNPPGVPADAQRVKFHWIPAKDVLPRHTAALTHLGFVLTNAGEHNE